MFYKCDIHIVGTCHYLYSYRTLWSVY